MSTNYHTAISTGASNAASTWNTPLGTLDAQISTNVIDIEGLTTRIGTEETVRDAADDALDVRIDALVVTAAGSGGVASTTLAANATGGGSTIDVDDGSIFVDGSYITVVYDAAGTVHSTTVNGAPSIGGGAGGSDRITLTDALAGSGTVASTGNNVSSSIAAVELAAEAPYNDGNPRNLPATMAAVAARKYHPMLYGCTGDGTTDDRAALNTLLNTTMSSGGTCIVDRSYKVNSALTVPAGVTLEFTALGKFIIPNDVTITINGMIDSAPRQIFSCTGRGNVDLSNLVTFDIYPEWWGAATSGTDNSDALRSMFRALPYRRNILWWGNYKVQAAVMFCLFTRITGTGVQGQSKIGIDTTFRVNRAQIVKVNATGGTFTLTYNGQTTAAQAYNVSASSLQTALDGLSSIADGSVYVTRIWANVGSDNNYWYVVEFDSTHAAGYALSISDSTTGGTGATVEVLHHLFYNFHNSYFQIAGLQFEVVDFVDADLEMLRMGHSTLGVGPLENCYFHDMSFALSGTTTISRAFHIDYGGPITIDRLCTVYGTGSNWSIEDEPVYLNLHNGLNLRNWNYDCGARLKGCFIRVGSFCTIDGVWIEQNAADLPAIVFKPTGNGSNFDVRGVTIYTTEASGNTTRYGFEWDMTDLDASAIQTGLELHNYIFDGWDSTDVPLQVRDPDGSTLTVWTVDDFRASPDTTMLAANATGGDAYVDVVDSAIYSASDTIIIWGDAAGAKHSTTVNGAPSVGGGAGGSDRVNIADVIPAGTPYATSGKVTTNAPAGDIAGLAYWSKHGYRCHGNSNLPNNGRTSVRDEHLSTVGAGDKILLRHEQGLRKLSSGPGLYLLMINGHASGVPKPGMLLMAIGTGTNVVVENLLSTNLWTAALSPHGTEWVITNNTGGSVSAVHLHVTQMMWDIRDWA